jgi:hypothetical protein
LLIRRIACVTFAVTLRILSQDTYDSNNRSLIVSARKDLIIHVGTFGNPTTLEGGS